MYSSQFIVFHTETDIFIQSFLYVLKLIKTSIQENSKNDYLGKKNEFCLSVKHYDIRTVHIFFL